MKKVFARTSGVILTIALLCNTISAVAVNTNPVKDVIAATSVKTIKEVAKTSRMATVAAAASKLWQTTKTFAVKAAQQSATFVNNHRIAVIGGVAAASALFAGYKCFKCYKARQKRAEAVKRNEQTKKDGTSVLEGLTNNYMVKHPEVTDRNAARQNVLKDQEDALRKSVAPKNAAKKVKGAHAPKADAPKAEKQ